MLLSKHNPKLKYVRKLSQKKFRDNEGKFIIEGTRFVEEAVGSNWPLEMVLCSANYGYNDRGQHLLEKLNRMSVPVWTVDETIFAEVAGTETPQGVLAVAAKPAPPNINPSDLAEGGKNLLVMVDGVKDPGNLGTIIRCADAAGVDCLLLLKGTSDPFNAKTLRSTMGSVFHIPIAVISDIESYLHELQLWGWSLVVGDPVAGNFIYDLDLTGKVVLVVGGEAEGVSRSIRNAAGNLVKIPMPGRAESLNAGVAAGIMLYETVRQRTLAGGRNVDGGPHF